MLKKIFILLLSLIIFISFSGCTADSTTNESNNNSSETTKNIYTDENISVDFVKISNSVVNGNFELYIRAENKTDEAITVYLKDVTINGAVIQVGSGVSCDIIAGAHRTHGFFGRLDLAGISTAEEANKITFKIWVVDDSMNTILTTADLIIDL